MHYPGRTLPRAGRQSFRLLIPDLIRELVKQNLHSNCLRPRIKSGVIGAKFSEANRPAHKQRGRTRCSGQRLHHEDGIRVFPIVSERPAGDKTVAFIEAARGLEGRLAASLEVEL